MKSRPVLFSAPMIRALLDGRKTQTRRVVTTREPLQFIGGRGEESDPDRWGWFFDGPDHHGYMVLGRGHDERRDHGITSIPCPYGEPGDRLWCKETWGLHAHGDETDWLRGSVRGVPEGSLSAQYSLALRADWGPLQEGCLWRPAIFMPRWASRITLEVSEVRVRLQSISEDDARAEGVDCHHHAVGADRPTYSDSLRLLWDSINGKRAPWFPDEEWLRCRGGDDHGKESPGRGCRRQEALLRRRGDHDQRAHRGRRILAGGSQGDRD